ncbi:uncharacterized protein LOC111393934 [Olea europaea var. sylvestris]|uniref:uncharacterized protein LOC111393934 n=1 Tax=Olea europaea var. sylvestris TaxID=158386 RepID=UPI000C1D4575|nr:uncharacterized protein LOC111393934 [Olea europaea var. sylvestris]
MLSFFLRSNHVLLIQQAFERKISRQKGEERQNLSCSILLVQLKMPLKRKLKHVLTIRSAAPPNSGNGSPSSRGQGEHSDQLHIFVSTPSTTQSGINTTTQSIVDPTTVASTTEQDASNNMHLIILNIL